MRKENIETSAMLAAIKEESNIAFTENGAVTNLSTLSDCLDLFATAGAMRNAKEKEIIKRFMRAFAEDKEIAMKTLFFARDIRGGLGERRFFRIIIRELAETNPESVIKNIENIAEYGRCDDILALIGTRCEKEAISYICKELEEDRKAMNNGESISLMAKWLPSTNASSKETVRNGKKIVKAMNMTEESYRKMLSSMRAHIRIIENNLRTKKYTFAYEEQPSKALFKYRKAFMRNDKIRYDAFIEKAVKKPKTLNTSTLVPYDIIVPALRNKTMPNDERKTLDATWNALENYVHSDNSLVVVDGSGSMYCGGVVTPAAVAQSLAIYFAERNKGAFANHFITFSANPRLVEIKGKDIFEKVRYCMSFNECANTNIERTFDLILQVAIKREMTQADMPDKLIIISDMEFDTCTEDANVSNFENAKAQYAKYGYKLPKLVFWNVDSRTSQQPVTMIEHGFTVVSGMSTQIFAMMKKDELDPYSFMMSILNGKRYAKVAA